MTWRAILRRLWRLLRLRFRNFHECPECGVPMTSLPWGLQNRWECLETNCARYRRIDVVSPETAAAILLVGKSKIAPNLGLVPDMDPGPPVGPPNIELRTGARKRPPSSNMLVRR